MIIFAESDSLVFITQPDHARLAAEIMAVWSGDGFANHPRRDAILLATREHDNGWREEDAETHVDGEGNPLDFIHVPSVVRHRLWPRGVGRLGSEHPYEGALVAQHALTVYSQYGGNPEWRSFFDTLAAQRAALLARCGREASRIIEDDYPFVRMGDLLSLAFCNRWREPADHAGRRLILSGAALEISPDPFGGARVPLRVRARRLLRRHYASSADLRAALDEAPLEFIEGEARGA